MKSPFAPSMAELHITKVAFGCRDVEALKRRIESRVANGELRVPTRLRPRRADELIGGNLYWIVKHRIVAAQRITAIADRPDGRVDIVCVGQCEPVAPIHRRSHQGWRYLENADSPPADGDGSGVADLPPRLYGALSALALV